MNLGLYVLFEVCSSLFCTEKAKPGCWDVRRKFGDRETPARPDFRVCPAVCLKTALALPTLRHLCHVCVLQEPSCGSWRQEQPGTVMSVQVGLLPLCSK